MGADAPLRRSADPQRNVSKAMDDRLARISRGMVIRGSSLWSFACLATGIDQRIHLR